MSLQPLILNSEQYVKKSNAPVLSFDELVQSYVSKNNPKLIILTPCYGSVCFVNFVHCLMITFNLFRKYNFPIEIEFCKGDSLISRARNNLIARAMNDTKCTHMMFIDNDITWDPIDILKLIIHDKLLIGGVYPLKHYDWETISNENTVKKLIDKKNNSPLKNYISDSQMIQYNLLKYNINFISNVLEIEQNVALVKHLATGFMLIKREVIEKMTQTFPSTKYTDDVGFLQPQENKYAYALFDCGVEEGHYFSEDWLFCKRWSKMGGNIYIDVSINLTHTGIEDYRGSFISSIL